MAGGGTQVVVVAAERHDALPALVPGEPGDAIRLQPRARDHPAGEVRVVRGGDQPCRRAIPAAREPGQPGDLSVRQDPDAGPLEIVGQRERQAPEVDDAGLRNPQRTHAGHVRLDLADALGSDLV